MSSPNFLSDEWYALKAKINEDIKTNQQALERHRDIGDLRETQGAIKALKSLLKMEEESKKPQRGG